MLSVGIAAVLAAEGFLSSVEDGGEEKKRTMKIELRYQDDGSTMIEGMRRVSSPGRRVYVNAGEVPRVRNGLGISVLSTSKGVICDREAREHRDDSTVRPGPGSSGGRAGHRKGIRYAVTGGPRKHKL